MSIQNCKILPSNSYFVKYNNSTSRTTILIKYSLFLSFQAGVALSTALPVGDNENGKYQNSVDNKSDGKYRPSSDGKYRPSSRGEGNSFSFRTFANPKR